MKSLFETRGAPAASRSFRFWQQSLFAGVALGLTLLSGNVFGQGAYYPVDPPGAPYGGTYIGISIHADPNLQFLQTTLQANYPTKTLEVPIPAGKFAPTGAEYYDTVNRVFNAILSGVGVPVTTPTITRDTMAVEAVAYQTPNATQVGTVTQIAQTFMAYNVATASNNLKTVVAALAKSQPTLIDTLLPPILTQVGTNFTTAPTIASLVGTAITGITDPTLVPIPDLTRVASLVNSGLTALSNATGLTAFQKGANYISAGSQGYVRTLIALPVADNNPAMIDAIVKGVTFSNFLTLIPPSGGFTALEQVLNRVVATLPTINNYTMGAVADGALRSQGASAAGIGTRLAALNAGTASYTNAVVYGYSNTTDLASFKNAVLAFPALADAIASGGMVKAAPGATPALIVQWALTNGSAGAASVVAASVGASLSNAVAIVTGAINPGTHVPYGSATFGQIAYGAALAGPESTAGDVVKAILQASSASITTLNPSNVTDVVANAIQGVTDGDKTGAYADIIYKAETVARNTSGASVPLVNQAVASVGANSPHAFIGLIAALAGDVYGANRSAIRTAGITDLGAYGAAQVAAGNSGADLIKNLQTSAATTFTDTLAAFNAAAGAPESVLADIYGAILANPTEADAGLAAAIKQASNPLPNVLTLAAYDAIRATTGTQTAALSMVGAVAAHLKTEAVTPSGITDLFDYVGHQIITNSALTKDIAIAATVVDPDHAHFVAHSVAFNNPGSLATNAATNPVAPIFAYAQITNTKPLGVPTNLNPSGVLPTIFNATSNPTGTKTFSGTTGAVFDQPAAAAAITAGLTTGILEANLSPAATQADLIGAITAAVAASVTQNGTLLRGPTNPFNATTANSDSLTNDTAAHFRQSDGGVGTEKSSGYQTYGAAGAITGYIAQVSHLSTVVGDANTTISDITKAVLAAATGGAARNYALQIAQAAAQALRWVGGVNVSTAAAGGLVAGNPIFDIATAMATTVTGFATLAQLENAAAFGIARAAEGVIGAGALGLNAINPSGGNYSPGSLNAGNGSLVVKATGNDNASYYIHRSATGTPVTDIFNL